MEGGDDVVGSVNPRHRRRSAPPIREITESTQKITQISERTHLITQISVLTPPIREITESTHL